MWKTDSKYPHALTTELVRIMHIELPAYQSILLGLGLAMIVLAIIGLLWFFAPTGSGGTKDGGKQHRTWTFNRIFIIGWVLYFALGTGYDSLRHYQRYNALRPDMIVTYSITNGLMGFIWPLGILSRINDAVYERRNPPTTSSLPQTTTDLSRGCWDSRSENGAKTQSVVDDEIEQWAMAIIDHATEIGNDYQSELEDIGGSTALDPTRLENDKTFMESRAILRKAREVVQRYRAKHSSLLESSRLQISNLDIDSDIKREMLQHFDKIVKKWQPKIDRAWDIEEKCVDEYENMLNILEAKSGSWTVARGKLVFQIDQDAEKYNAFLANIRYLTMEQKQIIKNAEDASKAGFARMRGEF